MRKLVIIFIIILKIFTPSVQAMESINPYILVTTINSLPVNKDDCTILIQEQYSPSIDESMSKIRLEEYQKQLIALETQFNDLNRLIEALQTDPDYSIENAKIKLNETIEMVYQQHQSEIEFVNLSEEEQLAIVSQDESIIAWQNQLNQIIAEQNEAIALRTQVESDYQNTLYSLEQETINIDNMSATTEELNQCLLYPYSVPKLPTDSVLIDDRTKELSVYISSLDQYLQKLIPYSYRNVTFEQIFQAFNHQLSGEDLERSLIGKESTFIDPLALQQYTYEKELNRYDIEILANIAQRELNTNRDKEEYSEKYIEVLHLKENQFKYFVQLNQATWDLVKANFAKYLNQNGYTDEKSIKLVQQLHLKNQVKLVLFNDSSQEWIPVDNQQTGYLFEYSRRNDILFEEYPIETSVITEVTNDGSETTEKNIQQNQSNLDYLKEKLASNKSGQSGASNLPTTSTLHKPNTKTKKQEPKENNTNISLPSTGELNNATLMAIIFVLFGAVLLLWSRISKRKRKEKLEKIELE